MAILERIFLVLSLLYFAGGLTPSDLAENQHSRIIDRINSLILLAVMPILMGLILRHWRKVFPGKHSFVLPLVFSLFSASSILWSPSPGFTLRRSGIMLAYTLFALYIGSRLTLPEQIDLFGWMAVTFVIATYVIAVVKPEWALSTGNHWGNWKGVFGHKNTLGRMALFAATVMVAGCPKGVPKLLRIVTAIGATGLVALSGSATSIMAACVMAVVWVCLPILRQRRPQVAPLWLALFPLFVCLVIALLANFGVILQSLGRDPTLTGRTTLWSAIIEVAQTKPFLGFGYASFWHYNGPERAALFSQVGWTPPHAHNAYLDMWLDLGYLGLALLAVLIVSMLIRSAKLYQLSPSRAAGYPLMLVFFVLVVNCTESDLFRTHAFLWGPLISLYTALKMLDAKARQAPDPIPQVDNVLFATGQ